MEEIMSDFISAIKRFIEDWERNHPAALVHYEPADDVVNYQADEPQVEISQLPEPEVPREISSPKEQLGQPPYGEGEGPGQWVMGLGNWQWLPDKPTEPPKGETFKTGKWVRDSTTENWSWISLRPETTKTATSKDGRSTIEPTPSPRSRTRPLAQPTKSDKQLLEEAEQLIKEVEQLIKELE
jgi:hypothetical protein